MWASCSGLEGVPDFISATDKQDTLENGEKEMQTQLTHLTHPEAMDFKSKAREANALGVVVQAYDPSTKKTETGGFSGVTCLKRKRRRSCRSRRKSRRRQRRRRRVSVNHTGNLCYGNVVCLLVKQIFYCIFSQGNEIMKKSEK